MHGLTRSASGNPMVKGIGPVLAGRLVDCFGDETLRVIDKQPERLAEARGSSLVGWRASDGLGWSIRRYAT